MVRWFHGKQSRQASERLLMESGHEGDFLMRYSSVEGAFTVDYIKRQKICHFNNIRNDASGGVCVLVGACVCCSLLVPASQAHPKGTGKTPEQQKAYKFTSMSAFITKNEHIFVNPCANPRSHFQWLKLRIPESPSERAEAKADAEDEEEDSSEDEHEDLSTDCLARRAVRFLLTYGVVRPVESAARGAHQKRHPELLPETQDHPLTQESWHGSCASSPYLPP